MVKLIVSDLDGTILQHGMQTLPTELFDIIRQLKKRGIHFVAASGRQFYNMQALFHEVKDDMHFISENGGLYAIHGELHMPLAHNREFMQRLIQYARNDEFSELTYACAHTTYIESTSKYFLKEISQLVDYSITQVEDLSQLKEDCIKMAICNRNGVDSLADRYKQEFHKDAHVVSSGTFWLDFMPHGVNKGEALSHLLSELAIDAKDCIAFGDQWNDIEMLKMVGTSYAMTTAAPGISNHCSHQTDNVLKELRKLLQ